MSQGFIFDWTRTDLAGRIHVTDDQGHEGDNAAFGLSDCSSSVQSFLRTHDAPPSPPIKVTFDLFDGDDGLIAMNIN